LGKVQFYGAFYCANAKNGEGSVHKTPVCDLPDCFVPISLLGYVKCAVHDTKNAAVSPKYSLLEYKYNND
jgi:hypothetical protein